MGCIYIFFLYLRLPIKFCFLILYYIMSQIYNFTPDKQFALKVLPNCLTENDRLRANQVTVTVQNVKKNAGVKKYSNCSQCNMDPKKLSYIWIII